MTDSQEDRQAKKKRLAGELADIAIAGLIFRSPAVKKSAILNSLAATTIGDEDSPEKQVEAALIERLRALRANGEDPLVFAAMLTQDQDRRMKAVFGVAFFVAAIFFTVASYVIVAFAGVQKWGLGAAPMTALIVQAPVQFVGILYVIARNLFPGSNERSGRRNKKKNKNRGRPNDSENLLEDSDTGSVLQSPHGVPPRGRRRTP